MFYPRNMDDSCGGRAKFLEIVFYPCDRDDSTMAKLNAKKDDFIPVIGMILLY